MSDSDEKDKGPDTSGDGKLTVGDLREFIAAEVKKVAGTLTATDNKTHDDAEKVTEKGLDAKSNIADQVADAIKHIKDKEDAANRDKDIDTKIGELFKRTEETPPVERRRVHKVMGWGE